MVGGPIAESVHLHVGERPGNAVGVVDLDGAGIPAGADVTDENRVRISLPRRREERCRTKIVGVTDIDAIGRGLRDTGNGQTDHQSR